MNFPDHIHRNIIKHDKEEISYATDASELSFITNSTNVHHDIEEKQSQLLSDHNSMINSSNIENISKNPFKIPKSLSPIKKSKNHHIEEDSHTSHLNSHSESIPTSIDPVNEVLSIISSKDICLSQLQNITNENQHHHIVNDFFINHSQLFFHHFNVFFYFNFMHF